MSHGEEVGTPKWALERALKFNGHIECKCAVREGKSPCGFCRDMALEFDAIALESERNVCQILRGENSSTAAREPLRISDAMDSYRDAIARERDELMEKLVMLTLPELPLCPYHGTEPPTPIADCSICWQRFYIPFDYAPKLSQINHQIELYHSRVKRAQEYIALRAEGFETNVPPPKDLRVEFALPGGERVTGKEIDDLMGGTFPVRDDDSEISSYLGWKQIA